MLRRLLPSKNELARSCKIVQESCMQDLLGTCTRYVPFLARFLHNLAHILQDMVQDFARDAARIITCKFAHFFARSCKNWCKNRARKGTYRVHVPSKSCMQDSCTILHDLASSFLLGCNNHKATICQSYLANQLHPLQCIVGVEVFSSSSLKPTFSLPYRAVC